MLIFDLDGTISDPLEGMEKALNLAFVQHGFPELPTATIAEFIGPPLEGSFQKHLGADQQTSVALIASYREFFRETYILNAVYTGVPEALAALREKGVRMGVCTSKRTDFAELILRHLGLRDYFEFVSGGDIGVEKWQQLEALKAAGTLAPQAMMIGDRDVDILAGKRNGLRTGGVLWGFGSRAELEAAEPDVIFAHPSEWLSVP